MAQIQIFFGVMVRSGDRTRTGMLESRRDDTMLLRPLVNEFYIFGIYS